MKKNLNLLVFFLFLSLALFANDYLSVGLEAYKNEDWSSAVLALQQALRASEGKNEEAHYWLVMAEASSGNFSQALEDAKKFMRNFPASRRMPEMQYQLGRLQCVNQHHDSSIKTLNTFLSNYPKHKLVPSAYFWIGENLYVTGRLDDARTIFSLILVDYPSSAKGEAARYKIALIDQAATQEELLRLLKLSHEEALKLSEEYEKQEKIYQQNLEAYQKKLGNMNKDSRAAELEKELIEERRKNAELYDKLTLLQMKNEELSNLIATLSNQKITPPENIEEVIPMEEPSSVEPQILPPPELVEEPETETEKTRAVLEELLRKAKALQSKYEEVIEEENNPKEN